MAQNYALKKACVSARNWINSTVSTIYTFTDHPGHLVILSNQHLIHILFYLSKSKSQTLRCWVTTRPQSSSCKQICSEMEKFSLGTVARDGFCLLWSPSFLAQCQTWAASLLTPLQTSLHLHWPCQHWVRYVWASELQTLLQRDHFLHETAVCVYLPLKSEHL